MAEVSKDALVKMTLQYCEACGGLWFKHEDSSEIYCAHCKERMEREASGR